VNTVRRKLFGEIEAFELGYGPFWNPPLTVHFYLLDGVAIDSGQRRMTAVARQIFERWRPGRLLLTHHHEDHSGNAALAQSLGADLFAPSSILEKLRRGFPILPYQHIAWGTATPVEAKPLPLRIETGRYTLEALPTPGHSRDHTVFLEAEQGWLFSGDLYIADRIKYFRVDERIDQQITSLRSVLQHDFDMLLCAHRPQLSGGRTRLERKLAYLEDFVGEVGSHLERGAGEREVLARMKHKGGNKFWVSGGNVSFDHMVRSAIQAAGG